MGDTMELQSTVITETPKGRRIEAVYADHDNLEQATASIVIRLPIERLEHPSPAAALLEALHRVQRLTIDEIEKTTQKLGR